MAEENRPHFLDVLFADVAKEMGRDPKELRQTFLAKIRASADVSASTPASGEESAPHNRGFNR